MRKWKILVPTLITAVALAACAGASGTSTGSTGQDTASRPQISTAVTVQAAETEVNAVTQQTADGALITVTGTGKLMAQPDEAQITIGVVTNGTTAQESQSENAKQVNAMIEKMKSLGIEEKDMATSGYYLNAEYDWSDNGNGTIIGYNTTANVTIVHQPIDEVGKIVSECVSAGANQFNGISFSVSNYDELYTQALASAVESARKHAEALAAASGKQLGDIVRMSEGTGQSEIIRSANIYVEEKALASMDAGFGMDVQAGEMEIAAPVTITYSLK